MILELEHSKYSSLAEKETIQQQIIKLSLKFSILSPYTAFIAVEKRLNSTNEEMILREIPIQISTGDKHLAMSSVRENERSCCIKCHGCSTPKLRPGIRCHCCRNYFCEDHFSDHDQIYQYAIEKLTERIEKLKKKFESNFESIANLTTRLDKWYACIPKYPLIDYFYENCNERQENLEAIFKDKRTELEISINRIMSKVYEATFQHKQLFTRSKVNRSNEREIREEFESRLASSEPYLKRWGQKQSYTNPIS